MAIAMNRKERRRQGIKETPPTLNITAQHWQNESKRVQRESITATLKSVIGLTSLILNSDFGFGEKRINRFLARLFEQYTCMESGHVTIKDIEEWCREKNIKFDELFKEVAQ